MSNGTVTTVGKVEHVSGVFETVLLKAIRDGKHFTEVMQMSRDYKDVLHDITMDSYERDDFATADASNAAYARLTLITDSMFATITAAHDKAIAETKVSDYLNREES